MISLVSVKFYQYPSLLCINMVSKWPEIQFLNAKLFCWSYLGLDKNSRSWKTFRSWFQVDRLDVSYWKMLDQIKLWLDGKDLSVIHLFYSKFWTLCFIWYKYWCGCGRILRPLVPILSLFSCRTNFLLQSWDHSGQFFFTCTVQTQPRSLPLFADWTLSWGESKAAPPSTDALDSWHKQICCDPLTQ